MNFEKVHFLIIFGPVVDAFFIRRSTLFWVPKMSANGRTNGRTDIIEIGLSEYKRLRRNYFVAKLDVEGEGQNDRIIFQPNFFCL